MRKFIPLILAGLLALVVTPSAFAKTYYPTRTDDPTPNGCKKHNCSLREAVISANHHGGSDKIVLKHRGTGYNLSRTGTGETASATGDLDLNDAGGAGLTIVSSNTKLVTVSGHGIDRVFHSFYKATFKYLKIRGGGAPSYGGGIYAGSGKTLIYRCVITGNRAFAGGGGISSSGGAGRITIAKSTIHANRATAGSADGGGIHNDSPMSIKKSTINLNIAFGNGGGLSNANTPYTTSITNSTFANNGATGDGGGILNDGNGAVVMNAVTVARNFADTFDETGGRGGGLYNNSGRPFKLQNSLLHQNSANGNPGPNCYNDTSFTSLGHNLVSDDSFCGFVGSDYVNSETSPVSLGFLASNGGPTKTLKIGKHSKARNRANGNAPNTDQRGHRRHNPDIGAFEY